MREFRAMAVSKALTAASHLPAVSAATPTAPAIEPVTSSGANITLSSA
jgi:hypothetical protein